MRSRTLMFNLYPPPNSQQHGHFYANDPVVQLSERNSIRRNSTQHGELVKQRLKELTDSPFGSSLAWAYREYKLQRLFASDADSVPLGTSIGVPVSAAQRRQELLSASNSRPKSSPEASTLYLFNVLVALEWIPSDIYVRQLEWAFRRASDVLYDVSNGTLAFGQILFADNLWMKCADIQITASNRTLPRSWVSGLHEGKKFTPIRVGRGVWSRRARRALAWDEPEAYRTLVHEWGHYALELRDEYLTERSLADCADGTRLDHTVVVPDQRAASESIMATPDGNSELANPLTLSEKHFPNLNMPAGYFAGPGRLPLPLPVFGYVDNLRASSAEELAIRAPEQLRLDSAGVPVGECAVYVLRRNQRSEVQRIVAQGVLDGGSAAAGFRLLGARPGDHVVVNEGGDSRGSTIHYGVLSRDHAPIDWQSEPAETLLTAVKPLGFSSDEQRIMSIVVTGRRAAAKAIVYPVGEGALLPSKRNSVDLPTLDGHLLIESGGIPRIIPYSQGGSPATTVAVTTNPIPAGSSDGDLLLFFSTNAEMSDERRRGYANVRVVTTTIPGSPAYIAEGARAVSKIFGVASNAQLDPDLSPTAVFFFDPATIPAGFDLRVFRLNDKADRSERLPTCVPQGAGFAAVPLAASLDEKSNQCAGGTLVQEGNVPDRVEYFQLLALPT